eukprot:Skav220817  [mRNA]  locus=scaffold150:565660:566023:+ [translate_table: standard]
MFHVTVGLASGRSESFSIAQSAKVRDFKLLVQKAFSQDLLRLVTADGHVLVDYEQSLEAAGVQSGDHMTAIPQRTKHIAATGEPSPSGALEATKSSHGAMKSMAVTAQQFKSS